MNKMNINEACAFAKKIEQWKRELTVLLAKKEYIYDIEERHLKSLADTTKTDEIINATNDETYKRQYEVSIKDICSIIEKLVEEKVKVSSLIEQTKNSLVVEIDGKEMTVDTATEYNKNLRDFAYYLNSVIRCKDSVTKTEKRDFRLDVEGKQTPYVYPCEISYKTTFERKEIENKKRDLLKRADKNSIIIDKARITSEIELDTVLEVTDSLEDVINKLLK